jgi:type IV pilus assembly protein PilP
MACGLATLLLGLGGCFDFGGDDEESGAPAERAPISKNARPAKDGEAKAGAGDTRQTYTYNAIGKRDPFRSYIDEEDESKQVLEKKRPKQPLENFTLDQLRLTGIITGIAMPMAMVEDPSGRGHMVKVGERVGPNSGRVSAILRDKLVITEECRDAAGRKRFNKLELTLPQEILTFGQ